MLSSNKLRDQGLILMTIIVVTKEMISIMTMRLTHKEMETRTSWVPRIVICVNLKHLAGQEVQPSDPLSNNYPHKLQVQTKTSTLLIQIWCNLAEVAHVMLNSSIRVLTKTSYLRFTKHRTTDHKASRRIAALRTLSNL